jgi:flagellar biosynthesis chaperone FliJ
MVDGKTIDRLRHDLTSVTEEVRQLRKDVAELQKKTKIIEVLDTEEFQSFVLSRPKKD